MDAVTSNFVALDARYSVNIESRDVTFQLSMLQLAARYSAETEAEVIQWFQALLQKDLQPGMREMEKQLKDGVLLVEYVT